MRDALRRCWRQAGHNDACADGSTKVALRRGQKRARLVQDEVLPKAQQTGSADMRTRNGAHVPALSYAFAPLSLPSLPAALYQPACAPLHDACDDDVESLYGSDEHGGWWRDDWDCQPLYGSRCNDEHFWTDWWKDIVRSDNDDDCTVL